MNLNCGIYKIINTINGKCYIGSSKDIEYRRKRHFRKLNAKNHPNEKLQNAYNLFPESFQFKLIIVCEEIELKYYEQLCIDRLNPEYNISKDAFRPSMGLETRLKIAKSIGEYQRSLGEKHTSKKPEVRKKMSDSLRGRVFTDRHRKNLRNSLNRDGRISPNKGYEKRNNHSNYLKSMGESHASKRPSTKNKMKDWWRTDAALYLIWFRENVLHRHYWGA